MTKEIEELQYKYDKALGDLVRLSKEMDDKDKEIKELNGKLKKIVAECCPSPFIDKVGCNEDCVGCWNRYLNIEVIEDE